MYIFKNAFKSINRNKGRNILIGIIIIVISCASTIALAIRNSASVVVGNYKENNPLIATLGLNREKVMELYKGGVDSREENIESFNNIPSITYEEILSYGDSKYLKSYYYTYQISLNSNTLNKATESITKDVVKTETKTTTSGGNGGFPDPSGRGGMFNRNTTTTITKSQEIFQSSKIKTGDFSLIGYSSYDGMEDFISGNYSIVSGSLFTDFSKYECVINKELATLNEVEVNDTITLKNSTNNKEYQFTVTGIYEEDSTSNSMQSMYSSSVNNIITSSEIVKLIMNDDKEITFSIEPSFILKDSDSIEGFTAEVEEKGLNEYYQVSTNLEDINEKTNSINNVKTFATTFLIITLIIGGIVLFVINMINIHERKYEIGVLRTIGMKKSLVISKFSLELLIVSIFGLSIGLLGGSILSVNTAKYLLQNEIEASNEKINDINKNFGMMNKRNNDSSNKDVLTPSVYSAGYTINGINKVNNINAVVNFTVIFEMLGIGLLLTLISSMSAMISISRFSPLTILKERS